MNDAMTKIEGGKNFTNLVKKIHLDKIIVTIQRIWRYNRRARDYQRLYLKCKDREGETSLSHAEIEHLRKISKTHRTCGEGVDGIEQQQNRTN